MNNEQNKLERILISEFVKQLGFHIASATWQDKPDALLTLTKGGRQSNVAIEHTEYCNDTEAGRPSPRSAIQDFWSDVSKSLVRRISQRPALNALSGLCTLREPMRGLPSRDRVSTAREFASEFVQLLLQNQFDKGKSRTFWRQDFDAFPHLKEYCESISAKNWERRGWNRQVSTRTWTCQNLTAGGVGFSTAYLVSAVKRKTSKAEGYNWCGADEKWLLIAASGKNPSHHVGGNFDFYSWNDPCLRCACVQSPFDRIYLWDVARSWHRQLKPVIERVIA